MRHCKSVRDELIKKSREAMMTAVEIYNNPLIKFKSESFIVLAIIAWTYLMHAYYHGEKIDYRYYKKKTERKQYEKTKYNAFKYWELERCLNSKYCPFDNETKLNLKFLIGIRHEIEHQMTNSIDEYLSAKLQACCMNYNRYMKTLFGKKYALENDLSLSLQFSPITPDQTKTLIHEESLSPNVRNFIVDYENALSDQEISSPYYAYRIALIPVNVNRRGQADKVIEFIPEGSQVAEGINKSFVLVKEKEKPKYIPTQIVKMMHELGYKNFNIINHTNLWKKLNIDRSKTSQYGTPDATGRWMWYEQWIDIVKKYCEENSKNFK